MGMGENIGYSTFVTQNNVSTYFYNYANTFVDIALMGDPTLRNHVVAPVSNVVATKSGYNCVITWSLSPEVNVSGYNIYMKNDTNSVYTRINQTPVSANSYTDFCLAYPGIYKYMVRAIKLENSPSGSYYNMSEGIADTAYNSSGIEVSAAFTTTINSGVILNVTSTSTNSTSWFWDFGNGTTAFGATQSSTYTTNGTYPVMLIASNPCSADTTYQNITIQEVGFEELFQDNAINVIPNPASTKVNISYGWGGTSNITVYTLEGRKVLEKIGLKSGEDIYLGALSKGAYIINIKTSDKTEHRKLILE
jgi:PKD repeat protein